MSIGIFFGEECLVLRTRGRCPVLNTTASTARVPASSPPRNSKITGSMVVLLPTSTERLGSCPEHIRRRLSFPLGFYALRNRSIFLSRKRDRLPCTGSFDRPSRRRPRAEVIPWL